MIPRTLSDWVLVGVDGDLQLYAERRPSKDDMNPQAVLYNTTTDTVSVKRPLQVFFKWGNFEAPEGQKGSERSGHWGHAGRPGHRGGSTPGTMSGRGRISKAYFEHGPGRSIIETLDPEIREYAIEVLTNPGVDPIQVKGLETVTTEPHPSCKNWRSAAGYKVGALYHEGAIHLNENDLPENNPERDDLPEFARDVRGKVARHYLAHELGHHVAGSFSSTSAWYNTPEHKKAYLALMDTYHALRERRRELIDDSRRYGSLTMRIHRAGLVERSMDSFHEFVADSFATHLVGNDRTVQLYEELTGLNLEELFGNPRAR